MSYGLKYNWKVGEDYPQWADIPEYLDTISKGYLLEGETPKKAYKRVCKTVAERLGMPYLASKFFKYIWDGWLCLASPVLSNTGTERGLPISCYVLDISDNLYDIGNKNLEMMMQAKNGGGVGIGISRLRAKGSAIKNNGTTDGIVPFCKIYDSTIQGVSQGSTRRGAASINLDIEHGDFDDWLSMREPKGDVNRQCLNIHQCAVISDKFMNKVLSGDKIARNKWIRLLQKRKATGEPYILFKDNVNNANPEAYKKNHLLVHNSNICVEMAQHTDSFHTLVCCLASLNMAKFNEWEGSDLIKYANYFLDGVMEEFIQKAKHMKGFQNSVRSAEKGRAVGLGVLGWHSYLQQKGIPFDSLAATLLTKSIFKNIREESDKASQSLAKKFGEPDWCEGTGYRNTHRLAIAPTTTNAKLAGGVSQSIEPWSANVFTEQTFKGTFIRKNKQLEKVLEELGENKQEVWDEILSNGGSVASLEFLDDYCYLDEKIRKKEELTENELMRVYEIKDVFKTFREIDQMKIVSQAAERQKFIDQSQSLNLAFHFNSSPKEFNQIHLEAWKKGIKTLYYVRTESSLNGATPSQRKTDCEWCEG